MNFFSEIKKRQLISTFVYYLGASWAIIESLSFFIARYNWNDSIFSYAVITIGFGLPATLIFQWFRSGEGDHKVHKVEIMLQAIIVLLASYFIYNVDSIASSDEESEIATIENSIAVLPFKNLSPDVEDQYFIDGMWDEILNRLARIEDLDKLISRTSSEKYKETTKTIPEIAAELNVAYILEGSVQKHANTVRVIVQLITAEDKHVWSENYDRDISDMFDVQTEISKKVAIALSIRLTSRELEQIEAIPTQNHEAYELYLRGNQYAEQFYIRNDTLDFEIAKGFYQQALELDPEFEMTLVGISELIMEKAVFVDRLKPIDRHIEYLDTAISVVNRAININPLNARAYATLGNGYYWKTKANYTDSNFQKTKDAYNIARDLAPSDPGNHFRMALLHQLVDRRDSAIYYYKKNLLVSPNSFANYWIISTNYRDLGLLEKAKVYMRKPLSEQPDNATYNNSAALLYYMAGEFPESLKYKKNVYRITENLYSLYGLIYGYILIGDYAKAEDYVLKGLETITEEGYNESKRTPRFRMLYGYILWQQEKKEEAMKYFNKQLELSEKFGDIGSPARIYSFLGDTEKAYPLLKEIFDRPNNYFWTVLNDPMYVNIRNDERVQQLIRSEQEKLVEMQKNIELMEASDELKSFRSK